MNPLLVARLKGFGFEAASMVGVGILGVFMSPEFQALITEHFGETLLTSTAVLLITGVAKHLRNVKAVGKLGATGGEKVILL